MWNLAKGNIFLPMVSLPQLKTTYAREENAKAKTRLLAAIHRKRGKGLDEIAYLVSTPRNTVYGWL